MEAPVSLGNLRLLRAGSAFFGAWGRSGCVTNYGCTSNAPTSHIGLRELRHGTGVQRTSTPLVWKLALTSWTDSAGSMTHSQPSGAIGVTMNSSVKSTLR